MKIRSFAKAHNISFGVRESLSSSKSLIVLITILVLSVFVYSSKFSENSPKAIVENFYNAFCSEVKNHFCSRQTADAKYEDNFISARRDVTEDFKNKAKETSKAPFRHIIISCSQNYMPEFKVVSQKSNGDNATVGIDLMWPSSPSHLTAYLKKINGEWKINDITKTRNLYDFEEEFPGQMTYSCVNSKKPWEIKPIPK